MTANVEISSVTLTPSTVRIGQSFLISAVVIARTFGIANAEGRMLMRADGKIIATKKEKG